MAINLDKIRADLNHQDPQIQTFALMSITRLSPELVNNAIEVQSIHDKLSDLVKSPNSDVVFLARKAVNHIDTVFKPFLKEAQAVKKPDLLDPREMSREELLNIVDPSLEATYLASLMVRFIAVGTDEDLSTLKDYLHHENARVRSNVVEVFEALGTSAHVDLIKPLTEDPNNRVRGNAILALVAMGYNDVGQDLAKMLCMGMISMRETAVFVLSKLSLPFVEKLLVKATSDPYEGVKLRATKALSVFVSPVAITRLRELMNDIDINICEAAIESLQIIKRTHQANKARKAAQQKAGVVLTPEPVAPPQPVVAPEPVASPQPVVASEPVAPPQPVVASEPVAPPQPVVASEPVAPPQPVVAPEPVAPPQPAVAPEPVASPQPVVASEPVAPPQPVQKFNEETLPLPAVGKEKNSDSVDPSAIPAGAGEFDDLSDAAIDESMERKIIIANATSQEADRALSDKRLLYRELGTFIYQLCRTNSLSHEIIDTMFYEILRFQDFLRAYLSRKNDENSDMESRTAIEQLQLKIEESFVSLGKSSLPLINDSSLAIKMSPEMSSIVSKLNE